MDYTALGAFARAAALNVNTGAIAHNQRNREQRRRQARPRMTASDARSFVGYSTRSMEQVLQALEDRKEAGLHTDCECEPYEDVFTLPRWNALGYRVKAGEKAMKLSTWVAMEDKRAESEPGEETDSEQAVESHLRPWTAHLFCRCQVQRAPEGKR